MRVPRVVLLPGCLLAHAGLVAQGVSLAGVPLGARVKLEAEGPVEGTLKAVRGDTAIVQWNERGDTVRIPISTLKTLRVQESPALWRYTTASNINFFAPIRVPRMGNDSSAEPFQYLLIVATKTELVGIHPVTGTVIWRRADLANLDGEAVRHLEWSRYGFVTRGGGVEVVDVQTGRTCWDARNLSFSSVAGWLPLQGRDTLLLILGATDTHPSTLAAVEIPTGKIRWRQDSLITITPKTFKSGGVYSLFGNQEPLGDSDSTLILYLSGDGPMRLDARTGGLLWRASVLRNAPVPARGDGYAQMRAARGVVFVPSEKSLLALRTSDGSPAWAAPRVFEGRVIRLELTRRGLLVYREGWLDLLDPVSGKSIWPANVELKHGSWIVLRGDTVYTFADKQVLAVGLATGSKRAIATVTFKEGEVPSGVSVFRNGLVLNSWHYVALVDRNGHEIYRRNYGSPKESFGEGLRRESVGTGTRRPRTFWLGKRLYFFTGDQDAAGREGFSIVKFDPAQGVEAGRVWLNKRMPMYEIETGSSVVYYLAEDREIRKLTFLDWTALGHAVRNGHVALAERLIGMGADPRAVNEDGWTPLHVAARAGQLEAVTLLMRHGASLDAASRTGWRPWMLAAVQGHDSVVQALRDAGATYEATTATLLHGWYLSFGGRVEDAVAAYAQAYAADSTLPIFPHAWRSLCWNGSVRGQAGLVMAACEQAVVRTPVADEAYATARFGRGIARALTGDLGGAASDLEPSLDPEGEAGNSLQFWIDTLRGGNNPFTPEVLDSLRLADQ